MCIDLSAATAGLASLAGSLAPGRAPLPQSWSAGDWTPGPELFGIKVESDVPIRMNDGVVLRATVGYPTDLATGARAPGPFPVLLEQSPYHHRPAQDGVGEAVFALVARYFVTRGYIYVSAQVRGTHLSGGCFSLLSEREKADGVELVHWVAGEMEGSNGRVGLTGCSYTGLNQYFTAALVGPDSPVKAIAPAGVGVDWYREPAFMGGAPTVSQEKALSEVWANGGTTSAVRFTLDTLAEIKAGGDDAYDREFWQSRSAAEVLEHVVENRIPALLFAYWRDYPTSPGEAYAMLQNAYCGRDLWAPMAHDQATTPRYQLIMGSEPHCAGRDGGPMAEAVLRWFDIWVKGVEVDLDAVRSTVHLNDLDTHRWLSGRAYPPVADYRTYYLHPAGALADKPPEADDASDRLCYAAPAYPGASLVYTTEPFVEGVVLAGPISATLFATSTTRDILVIVDVFDLAPDGGARQLATGALVGSHRRLDESRSWRDASGRLVRPYHPSTADAPMSPGEVVRLDIQIQPRVASLAAGHSLRFILKTQSDPAPCVTVFPAGESFWCVSPTVPQRRALEGATFEILRSRTSASLINVPLLFEPLE